MGDFKWKKWWGAGASALLLLVSLSLVSRVSGSLTVKGGGGESYNVIDLMVEEDAGDLGGGARVKREVSTVDNNGTTTTNAGKAAEGGVKVNSTRVPKSVVVSWRRIFMKSFGIFGSKF
jgi:hypothetical protein